MQLEALTSCPHIRACIVAKSDSLESTPFGETSWAPMLRAALPLMDLTAAGFIRLVVGEHSIVIQREGGVLVGVVFDTGKAVAKSLHRMIRRACAPGPRRRSASATTNTAPDHEDE